jgi:Family of unknown function (DUF5759)
MLTAKDIAEREKARQNVKKETYKALLEQFCRKIRTSWELGRPDAILTVPPFVVGYPRYDLAKTVTYMCRQLLRLGYQVDLIGPLDIRVRWHVSQFKNEIEEDDPFGGVLPGLANLKKTAQRLKQK